MEVYLSPALEQSSHLKEAYLVELISKVSDQALLIAESTFQNDYLPS